MSICHVCSFGYLLACFLSGFKVVNFFSFLLVTSKWSFLREILTGSLLVYCSLWKVSFFLPSAIRSLNYDIKFTFWFSFVVKMRLGNLIEITFNILSCFMHDQNSEHLILKPNHG